MTSWLKLLGLAAVVVIAAQVWTHRVAPTAPAGAAPALSLPTPDGRTVDLSAYRGKVVAVNFWATWCGPCRAEIPELAQVWREHKDGCFELLGVAEESGKPAQIASKAAEYGIPYPVLVDQDGAAGDRYRVTGYPNTFLIDAEGKVAKVFAGAIDREALERALRPLLPATCPRA
ncbi:TlpA family protein disulfide reductase [Anaeromyxobacter paludicola]|uniref:Alkyl hydroperoxide reductase n=1 Tax=Anaeromyxobacter paludicola TaxID=2918171 RepID=A0ABM7X6W4_9BACT|nr:TlpA disulfide reductase family protein [Anaeromyxobacter paludicola]BDG07573.1 alkyl hydroperoxide reductase [Anaeromyxobacter paludicola]